MPQAVGRKRDERRTGAAGSALATLTGAFAAGAAGAFAFVSINTCTDEMRMAKREIEGSQG